MGERERRERVWGRERGESVGKREKKSERVCVCGRERGEIERGERECVCGRESVRPFTMTRPNILNVNETY